MRRLCSVVVALLIASVVMESASAWISIRDVYVPPKHELESNRTVPPLPYPSYGSWAVYTQTLINSTGNTSEQFSYGMHVNVDSQGQVLCQYAIQQLFPVAPYYTQTIVVNYTSGTNTSVTQQDDGTNTNCSTSPVTGAMQPGGAYWLAPSPAMMLKLKFLQYAVTNGYNCSVWQYLDSTGSVLVQWYLSVGGNIPQVFINETRQADGSRIIYTTAFNGLHPLGELNPACEPLELTCGVRTCVVNPSASTDNIQSALSWVCGVEDCSAITIGGSKYFPPSVYNHATVAFGMYYQANEAAGPGSCNFNGAAELVSCSTACTTCNATASATEEQLQAALNWACGPDALHTGGCAAIRPGGSNFFPNTTRAHADFAFNFYYQAYKCIPGWNSCDFNGTASIVPCN